MYSNYNLYYIQCPGVYNDITFFFKEITFSDLSLLTADVTNT